MILDILDEAFIQGQKRFLIARLEAEADLLEAGKPSSAEAAAQYGVEPEDLRNAALFLRQSEAPEAGSASLAYIPGDAAMSVLQTCLEDAYLASGLVVKPDVSGLAPGARAFAPITSLKLPQGVASIDALVPFEEGDPRYVSGFLMAKATRRLRSKPKFVDRPPRVKIEDKVRVVLFGDWGSGIERAQTLAKSIDKILAAAPDREGHAIHLGDVYFAGFEGEYEKRVIPYWPGAIDRSWSISGNHDMYAGGGPFFETMLGSALFQPQRKTSWFFLENENWQLFGLDSSFAPPDGRGLKGDLAGTQAEQVFQIRSAAPTKGGILLTHHQPFNVSAGQFQLYSDKMVKKLKPTLDQGLVRAWFWGHEHDCAVYRPWNNVPYPCLTGNAGVPELHKDRQPDPQIRWRWSDAIDTPDGKYATLGFTVLDLTGDSMEVSFYNEDGAPQPLPDAPHVIKSR